jgi:hypothetical protein
MGYDLSSTERKPIVKMTGIVKQLKKERDRVERELTGLNAALSAFIGAYKGSTPTGKRRKVSAESRAKMVAASRARWARVRREKKKTA